MKTKKYLKGGEIAALAGLGLLGASAYNDYQKGKTDRRGDANLGSGESTPKPRINEIAPDRFPGGPEKEDRELSKRGKFPQEAGDETSGAGLDEYKNAPAPKPVIKKTTNQGTSNQGKTNQPSAVNIPSYDEAKRGRSRGLERKVMGVEDKKKPAGTNTFITKERSEQANKSVGRGWREQNPNLSKSQDEKFKDYQGRNAKYQQMLEGFKNKKAGGTVKKYAAGGSVSSASKRGDGIAMRGKTRGKVC